MAYNPFDESTNQALYNYNQSLISQSQNMPYWQQMQQQNMNQLNSSANPQAQFAYENSQYPTFPNASNIGSGNPFDVSSNANQQAPQAQQQAQPQPQSQLQSFNPWTLTGESLAR